MHYFPKYTYFYFQCHNLQGKFPTAFYTFPVHLKPGKEARLFFLCELLNDSLIVCTNFYSDFQYSRDCILFLILLPPLKAEVGLVIVLKAEVENSRPEHTYQISFQYENTFDVQDISSSHYTEETVPVEKCLAQLMIVHFYTVLHVYRLA